MSYNICYKIGCGHPKLVVFNSGCTLVSLEVFLEGKMPVTYPQYSGTESLRVGPSLLSKGP